MSPDRRQSDLLIQTKDPKATVAAEPEEVHLAIPSVSEQNVVAEQRFDTADSRPFADVRPGSDYSW